MFSESLLKENKGKLDIIKSKADVRNIKSIYILKIIFDKIKKTKLFNIIRYNKSIQNKLRISINDYKEYFEKFTPIEIEVIPLKNKYGKFININAISDVSYFHIYFNDNKEEIKEYYLNENNNISKIKILIDYQITSFKELFSNCKCIESINFKKFYRDNITNMSYMFSGCTSLKKLYLSKIKTNNATDMSGMFSGCTSLKKLNLSNFNTNNVTNMSCMFLDCSSLKELDISNFNTINVNNMSCIFSGCSSLKELNLSNFNTNNVNSLYQMFRACSSLKKLDISSFHINNQTDVFRMFFGCTFALKMKIKEQNIIMNEYAFK